MENRNNKLIFFKAITIFMLVIAIFSCFSYSAFAKELSPNLTIEQIQSKAWHLGENAINVKGLYKYIYDNFNIDIPNIDKNNPNNTVVAIIDSGLKEHPYFENAMWVNGLELYGKDGVDDDGNGIIDDINGANFSYGSNDNNFTDCMDGGSGSKDWHGTHVAGIVHSVCPNAKIMPIKAGRNEGGSGALFKPDDVIDAILYAANNGANIINMSFGSEKIAFANQKKSVVLNGVRQDMSVQTAINYAVTEKHCMVICAAGNNSKNINFYPASCKNVVSVMGSNKDNKLYSKSNYGNFDIMAPGEGILSTIAPNVKAEADGLKGSENVFGSEIIGFADKNGTSMASPIVAGVGALLMTATNTKDASLITPYLKSEKFLSFAKTDKMSDRNVLLDYKAIIRMLNNIEQGAIIDENDVYIADKSFMPKQEITLSPQRAYTGSFKWYLNGILASNSTSYTFIPKENSLVELYVNDTIKERYYIKSSLVEDEKIVYDNERLTLKPKADYTGKLTWYIDGEKVADGLSYTFIPSKTVIVELRENDFVVEKYIITVKSFDELVKIMVGAIVGSILGVILLIIVGYLIYKKIKTNKLKSINNYESNNINIEKNNDNNNDNN